MTQIIKGHFELSVKTKRNLLYINVAIYRILVSVEYAIIIPTLWPYLSNEYNSSSVYLGFCLAGIHMSALPTSIVVGILNDWKFRVKSLVLFLNLFRCVLASLYESLSVRPSVRRSVRRSRFRENR